VSKLGEGLMTKVSKTLMPKRRRGRCKEYRCRRVQRVEGPGAVTSDDLAPSGKILHRTAKGVKFHAAVVINSKLTNRNEVFNEVWCNKNVVKAKVVRKTSRSSGGDRGEAAISNNNARRRGNGGRG
jgi:hypothetical protein